MPSPGSGRMIGVSVALQLPRDGAQVVHDLDSVAGVFLAILGVDYDGFVVPVGDDVGPTGQRRQLPNS